MSQISKHTQVEGQREKEQRKKILAREGDREEG